MTATEARSQAAGQPLTKHKVLLVDDEPHILNSLQRVLRKEPYEVIVAHPGAEALNILFNQSVDLILSDQRMPEMNGSELLAKIRQRYPDTVRMILTGYQDMNAAISAINEGGAYQFLQKPWDDDQLRLALRKALEQYELKRENTTLRERVEAQNSQLQQINLRLEKVVEERTAEAQRKGEEAQNLYHSLSENFAAVVEVISSILSLRDPGALRHHQEVRRICDYLCDRLQITGAEKIWIGTAAVLHDVGKIGLPEAILQKNRLKLSAEEAKIYEEHSDRGAELLERISQLKVLGPLIRHHHERWDGKGFPKRIRAEEIPLGARMIAIASEYDHLRHSGPDGLQKAKAFIERNSGLAFQPKLVSLVLEFAAETEGSPVEYQTQGLKPHQLQAGMVAAEDLRTSSGVLVVGKEGVLSYDMIQKIRNYHDQSPFPGPVMVYMRK